MRGFWKRIGVVAVLAALSSPLAAMAAERDELYRARAIVTGQREETRHGGIAEALRYVLAKVSGDPRLVDDPRVAEMAGNADDYVVGFGYRDRMDGKPLADEQGSRDRPYDLTVDFDPRKIDAALQSLGRKPWTAARPGFVAVIGMRNGPRDYLLTADGGMDLKRQRVALALAADRFGIPVSLPRAAVLADHGLTAQALPTAKPEGLDAVAEAADADLVLLGSLTWSDEAHGWISEWRFAADGRSHRWEHRGGGFDEAFRKGVGGAARILSGNGQPE